MQTDELFPFVFSSALKGSPTLSHALYLTLIARSHASLTIEAKSIASKARDRRGESCLIDKDKPSPLFRALALCLCSSRFLSSNLKKSLTHGWLYESFRFRRTRCCMLTAYLLHLHSGCSFKIRECLSNKEDGLVCVSLNTAYFESYVLACAVLD